MLLLLLMLDTDEENASVGRVVAASSVAMMTVNRDIIEVTVDILVFSLFYERGCMEREERRGEGFLVHGQFVVVVVVVVSPYHFYSC